VESSSASAAAAAAATAAATRTFSLYHYNGISGHAKAIAELREVKVKLLPGLRLRLSSKKRELREVIQTRFSALVEYDKDQKINIG